MNKFKWVLTLQKTQTLTNGTKLETLEPYEFETLEDASETEFRIDKVGIWDIENVVSYSSKGIQYIEIFKLEEIEEKG